MEVTITTPIQDATRPRSKISRQILDDAYATISVDRQNDYGTPDENLARIAAIWSAVLNHPITSREVALLLVGLKLARAFTSDKYDSIVDLIGYAALAEHLTPERSTGTASS